VFERIRIYPTDKGYGDVTIFKSILQREKPDIIVFFSDPRFFTWAFIIDNEYRFASKTVFYHTWDNPPFPKFNQVWYSACDQLVLLSKFSYNLMHDNGIDCKCITHGGDPNEFFPVESDQRTEFRKVVFKNIPFDPEIVFFYNNRNVHRKRTGDIVMAFKTFQKAHPKSVLLMNTAPVDMDGTDLGTMIKQVEPSDAIIIINSNKISAADLNKMYNVADVTFNVATNEGFGLSCMESLLAGTPNIACATGGLIEQMSDGETTFGVLLKAAVRTLFGIPGNPYIWQDWVSIDQMVDAMETAYTALHSPSPDGKSNRWEKLGQLGREFIIKEYDIKSTVAKWDELLKGVMAAPSKYKRFDMFTLKGK
jgi:glycosyltransferase involved in cell wall biosynthesis